MLRTIPPFTIIGFLIGFELGFPGLGIVIGLLLDLSIVMPYRIRDSLRTMGGSRKDVEKRNVGKIFSKYKKGKALNITAVESGIGGGNFWLIKSKEGEFILAKSALRNKINSIMWEGSLMERLKDSEFFEAPRIYKTPRGAYQVKFRGEFYILYEYKQGTKVKRDEISKEKLINAAKAQARYHNLTMFFEPEGKNLTLSERPYPLADILNISNTRSWLRKARDAIPDGSGKFLEASRILLSNIKFFESQVDEIEKNTLPKTYRELFQYILIPNAIIHGDYNPSNILFTNDDMSGLVYFDHAIRTLRVTDFANGMIDIDWEGVPLDFENLITYLKAYQSEAEQEIKKEELALLPEAYRAWFLEGINKAIYWILAKPEGVTEEVIIEELKRSLLGLKALDESIKRGDWQKLRSEILDVGSQKSSRKFQAKINSSEKGEEHFSSDTFKVKMGSKEYECSKEDETGIEESKHFVRSVKGVISFTLHVPEIDKDIALDIDKEILDILSSDQYKIDFQEFLLNAIMIRGPDKFQDIGDGPIMIAILEKSESLFEDHRKNNFIGINRTLFAENAKNNLSNETFLALLAAGITHELRHESGIDDTEAEEDMLTKEDVDLSMKLAGESIRALIEEVESIAEDSLFVAKLKEIQAESERAEEDLSPVDMAPDEDGLPAGRLHRYIHNVVEKSSIPLTHWHKVSSLAHRAIIEDSEAFNVHVTGSNVLIATREREGIEARLEGIMKDIPGVLYKDGSEGYRYKRHIEANDLAERRTTIVVYCYRVDTSETAENIKKILESLGKNYRGDASIPNYTTLGLIAQPVHTKFPIVIPDGFVLSDEKTVEDVLERSYEKVLRGYKEMEIYFTEELSVLKEQCAGKSFEDIRRIIELNLSQTERNIKRWEEEIVKQKDRINTIQKRLSEESLKKDEKEALLRELDEARIDMRAAEKSRINTVIVADAS